MAILHSAATGNGWVTGTQWEKLSMLIVDMQKHMQSGAALESLLHAEKNSDRSRRPLCVSIMRRII